MTLPFIHKITFSPHLNPKRGTHHKDSSLDLLKQEEKKNPKEKKTLKEAKKRETGQA